MDRHLLIAVRLHADGMGTARYHGVYQGGPEWPPAPARLFQALVAGAAQGRSIPDESLQALQWLEQLPPPLIAAPLRTLGQAVAFYVPNNDADSLSDPTDLSNIRTAKLVQPSLFDGAQPLLYAWPLPEGKVPAPGVFHAAQSLYQLGRGVDVAWADAHLLSADELHALLRHYRGAVHRPTPGPTRSPSLACPATGSLASLLQRHSVARLRTEGAGKKARTLFTNSPKPRFAAVSYAPQQCLMLYDLRERGSARAWPWPLHRAADLIQQVREAAATRLRAAMPEASAAAERCLLGRAEDGSGTVALDQRVRIMPLPSIGAAHADLAVRRVLLEVPSACPLNAADLDWVISGLGRTDPDTGELSPWMLIRADDLGMQKHYTSAARHWQSLTAVVLPGSAARRRIDPLRLQAEAKPARERQTEEERAVAAVHQALRHAGVMGLVEQIHVQREPFGGRGRRAEAFADDTRFAKERLWHVAISFDRLVSGPLVIGDGRFLGLGVLAPSDRASGYTADPAAWTGQHEDGVFALQTFGAPFADGSQDPVALARAMRRAVMSRVQEGSGKVGRYFSGHAASSDQPDADSARHLAFHWDAAARRWLMLAPHRLARRQARSDERAELQRLDIALDGMTEVRAGAAGCLQVRRQTLMPSDAMLRPATTWVSATPYVVMRHRRLATAAAALIADAQADCARQGWPAPEVTVLQVRSTPGQPLQGELRLQFAVAVAGPLALGRTALLGGGLFRAIE